MSSISTMEKVFTQRLTSLQQMRDIPYDPLNDDFNIHTDALKSELLNVVNGGIQVD